MKPVGQAIPHESAAGHVSGSALYTDDLLGRFNGLLHAWPVMAPHAHADVIAINVNSGLEAPGVVAILTQKMCRASVTAAPPAEMNRCFPSKSSITASPWPGCWQRVWKKLGWVRSAWQSNMNCWSRC